MKPWTTFLLIAAPWLTAVSGAQELEPGVQTSSAAAPVQPAAQPGTPQPAAPAAAKATLPPKATRSHAESAPAASAPAASATAHGKSSDRIELDTTQISGNQELPKVMYVVPWRRADPGEFSGRPPNSLLDEALTPVDRDVFRRQNRYYGALQSDPTRKDEK